MATEIETALPRLHSRHSNRAYVELEFAPGAGSGRVYFTDGVIRNVVEEEYNISYAATWDDSGQSTRSGTYYINFCYAYLVPDVTDLSSQLYLSWYPPVATGGSVPSAGPVISAATPAYRYVGAVPLRSGIPQYAHAFATGPDGQCSLAGEPGNLLFYSSNFSVLTGGSWNGKYGFDPASLHSNPVPATAAAITLSISAAASDGASYPRAVTANFDASPLDTVHASVPPTPAAYSEITPVPDWKIDMPTSGDGAEGTIMTFPTGLTTTTGVSKQLTSWQVEVSASAHQTVYVLLLGWTDRYLVARR